MKIKNIKVKIIILWMQWVYKYSIQDTRSANFYVKMDAARAVHRFKHDGEHRARVYASLEKYF